MKESHIKMYCRLREGPAFKNNTLENYAAEKTKKKYSKSFPTKHPILYVHKVALQQ